jgi:hypothetical protein
MTTITPQQYTTHSHPVRRFAMRNIQLFFQCILLMLVILIFSTPVTAVTLTAPASGTVGQTIPFVLNTVESTFGTPSGCTMRVDFGDGTPARTINMHANPANCINDPVNYISTCNVSLSHVFGAARTYQIRTGPQVCLDLQTPLNATSNVTINAIPQQTLQEIDLPDGVVGMDYEYELGNRINRYQLLTGRMDTGLKILRNQIKGVPEREGKYRFQIRMTDPRGNTTDTWYNLKITKALLSVIPDPKKITLDRNRAGRFKISYTIKSSEQLDDTISSARGGFLAGNRTLGVVATPLSTKMIQGRARVTEQVTIPLEVIKTAQRLGIDQIRYQRTFNARYMDAATTSSTAITVGTGFTFTRIRITFLDHTTKKFVKRNEKIDGAQVELAYEGAGLLKGYWQVDDRILARVTKNLSFANSRTITLKLPQVPSLPTYSIGSHRLRFVITNPRMDISFPQVIYIVTGDDLSKTHPIHLLTPRDNSTIPADGLSFTWKNRRGVTTYRFEILKKQRGKTETVFSAYAKKAAYVIPARVARKKFSQGGAWQWRIIGMNRDNKPVAASMERSFTVDALQEKTTKP